MQLLSKAKQYLTVMAQNEVYPRDEIADPPGTAVLPIEIHDFAEIFVFFRTLCGVQSSLVRFAPIRAIAWGSPQSVAGTIRDFVFKGAVYTVWIFICICMSLRVFLFAKKMKFLTKGGIHCISQVFPWHFYFMREHSLVGLTEHDDSAANVIVHSMYT